MRAQARDLAAREEKLEALQQKLTASVGALVSGEDWKRALEFAAKFRGRSFGNTMLIAVQHHTAFQEGRVPEPMPTYVAGFRQWQSLNRAVMKGQSGYAILAPVTARFASSIPAEPESWRRLARGEKPGPGEAVRSKLVGLKPAYVWDVSQTHGDPIPEPPRPTLLQGQAPEGLWDGLADQITAHGFELRLVSDARAIGGANGLTDYLTREVSVRMDMDDAAQVKTLAHDLLTAPTGLIWGASGGWCRSDSPVVADVRPSRGRGCCRSSQRRRAGGPRGMDHDVTGLVVPAVGRVASIASAPGTVLLDATGEPVREVSDFFATMLASGASSSSLRSYGMALLRWWRFLAAVDVPWQRAGRVEARDFVLWMRLAGPASKQGGYAPATINHALAVVKMFYADRITVGDGPLVNPVPDVDRRAGRRTQPHHNPMQPFALGPRAPLRQKMPERIPRHLPDRLFDELFATLRTDRDRALLGFYVSTGARASELLGVTVDRVNPGDQRIGVHRKGSDRLQWLPASADAFVWLRLYEQRARRPDGEAALWLTQRRPIRPLTYSAARRMLQRANDTLGTAWTLHDLRHTAAQRMVEDPNMSLTDVQWVLGHAHITTTQIYLRSREDEVIGRILAHHRDRAERPTPPPPPPTDTAGYSPEVLAVLFGSLRS